MDELPRDVVQFLPTADSNGLQLPLRSIKHLACDRFVHTIKARTMQEKP